MKFKLLTFFHCLEKPVSSHRVSGKKKIAKAAVSNHSFKTESLTSLRNHYDAVKTETDKMDADRESCIGSLQDLKSNGLTSIEKLVQKEIHKLESHKVEQNNLLEAIQKSIDSVKAVDKPDNPISQQDLYQREDMESNLKVSKWLQDQGAAAVEPSGNESKGCQATPGVTDSGMQASPKVAESGIQVSVDVTDNSIQTSDAWIKEQEAKSQLAQKIQNESAQLKDQMLKENGNLSSMLQTKTSAIASLEQELEQAKQLTSEVAAELKSSLAQAKHDAKIELDLFTKQSDKKCNALVLEKEKILSKLMDRESQMKAFQKEIVDLQLLCKEIRSQSNESQKINDINIQAMNEKLEQKTLKVRELEKEISGLKLGSKSFQDVTKSLETRAHQLVNELNTVERSFDKCKMEKDVFQSKFTELQAQLADKTKSFNEKIDSLLLTEKKYRATLRDCKSKLTDCEEQLRKKEEKVNQLKLQAQQVDQIKKHFNQKVDELQEELKIESNGKLTVSEKYIALEKKFQSLEQNYSRLEHRSSADKKIHQGELESYRRENEKMKDNEFELTSRFESLQKDHELCIKRKFDLERQFRQKESKLQNEMEIVLRDSSSDYQNQIENLKEEMRQLSSTQSTRHEMEVQIKKLTRENKEMSDSLNQSMMEENLEKKRSVEQIFKLEATVKSLNTEKDTLKSQLEFIQKKNEESSQESKTKQEDFRDEVLYYKNEIANVRQTLQEQLKVCKQLQEERQDGGLAWQNEKKELAKELEKSKDKIKDSEIQCITIQEKCSKLTREINVLKSQQTIDEKKLADKFEEEKRRIQDMEVEHAKAIEIWVRNHTNVSNQNETLKQMVKDLELSRDVRMAKLETSEKICREDSESWRIKGNDMISKNQKLETQNREMSLLITTQEEQMRGLRQDNSNQSAHVTKIEERLESLESIKLDLKTKNLQLKEKLQVIEKDFHRSKLEASQYPVYVHKAEKLEEENLRLKQEREELTSAATKFKDNIQSLESEHKVLKRQCDQSEDIQNTLQQENEDLQLKLKKLASQALERLSAGKEELAQTRFDYQQEIQEKKKRIITLKEQISQLRQDLALTKAKQSDCENKSIQEVQEELDKLTSIHENEIKIKFVTIETLKRENSELKEKMHNLSEGSIGKYKKELAMLTAGHTDELKSMESQKMSLQLRIKQLEQEMAMMHGHTVEKIEVDQLITNHVRDLKARDQSIVSLKTKVADLQHKLEQGTCHDNIDDLLTNHKSQIKARDQNIASLKQQLKSKFSETKDHESEIKTRQELIESLESQVETLRNTLDNNLTNEEAIKKLSANHKLEIESRDSQISTLKTKMNSLASVYESNSNKMDELITNQSSEITSRDAKIEQLKNELSSLHTKCSQDISEVDKTEASLRGKVDSLQKQLQDLKSTTAAQQLTINDVHNKEIAERNDYIESLRIKLVDLERSHLFGKENLETLVTNKESELESRNRLIRSQQEEIDNLKQSIQQGKTADDGKIEQLSANQKDELSSRDAEIKKLTNQIAELKAGMLSERNQIKDYQMRLEESRKLSDEASKDLISKHTKEMQALKESQKSSDEARKDLVLKHKNEMKALKESRKHSEETSKDLILKHNKEMQALMESQKRNDEASRELKLKYTNEMKSLEMEKTDLSQKINEITAQCQKYQKELKDHETSHQKQMLRIKQLENDLLQQSPVARKEKEANSIVIKENKSTKPLG